MRISHRELEFIIHDIVEECRSIPTLTEHIINRSLTLGNLWEHIQRDKTFDEIQVSVDRLTEKVTTLNKLIKEELKCLI